jgi:acyl carrier protein
MSDIHEIERTVRSYIIDAFLGGDGAAAFSDDDDLLTVLDSLQLLRMVVALEGLYSIRLEDGDLSAENLGSVRRIAAFVAGKIDRDHSPAVVPDGNEMRAGSVRQSG